MLDLENTFKHFQEDRIKELTKKDFEGLGPEEHAYGVQLVFIR